MPEKASRPARQRQAKLDAKAKIKEQARTIPGQAGSPIVPPDAGLAMPMPVKAPAGAGLAIVDVGKDRLNPTQGSVEPRIGRERQHRRCCRSQGSREAGRGTRSERGARCVSTSAKGGCVQIHLPDHIPVPSCMPLPFPLGRARSCPIQTLPSV